MLNRLAAMSPASTICCVENGSTSCTRLYGRSSRDAARRRTGRHRPVTHAAVERNTHDHIGPGYVFDSGRAKVAIPADRGETLASDGPIGVAVSDGLPWLLCRRGVRVRANSARDPQGDQ
jgi:hypothetical protein